MTFKDTRKRKPLYPKQLWTSQKLATLTLRLASGTHIYLGIPGEGSKTGRRLLHTLDWHQKRICGTTMNLNTYQDARREDHSRIIKVKVKVSPVQLFPSLGGSAHLGFLAGVI